jgi:hypothetical protein
MASKYILKFMTGMETYVSRECLPQMGKTLGLILRNDNNNKKRNSAQVIITRMQIKSRKINHLTPIVRINIKTLELRCCHTPVIPATWRWRQEDGRLKASPGKVRESYLKCKNKQMQTKTEDLEA